MTKTSDIEGLYAAWIMGYADGKTDAPYHPPPPEGDASRVYGLAYKLGVKMRLEKTPIQKEGSL